MIIVFFFSYVSCPFRMKPIIALHNFLFSRARINVCSLTICLSLWSVICLYASSLSWLFGVSFCPACLQEVARFLNFFRFMCSKTFNSFYLILNKVYFLFVFNLELSRYSQVPFKVHTVSSCKTISLFPHVFFSYVKTLFTIHCLQDGWYYIGDLHEK